MKNAELTTHKFWPLYRSLCRLRRKTGSSRMAMKLFRRKYGQETWFPKNQHYLPTNQSEPEFRYNFWYKDHPECATANNCYSYSIGAIRHQKGDGSNGYVGQACKSQSDVGPMNAPLTTRGMCKKMKELMLCDIRDSYSKEAYVLKGKNDVPKNGYHRVAVVFDKQSDKARRKDYHFLKQHACGLFSHKSGWAQLPKFHDQKGCLILDPMKASLNYGDGINYNIRCVWIACPNRRGRKRVG